MDLQSIIFCFFAALAVLGAGVILLTRNVLYAAFALMLCFIGVAGLYVFAGADFVAATQVMVYVGGILILIVFGVMLTNRSQGVAILSERHRVWSGGLLALLLLLVLLQAIIAQPWDATQWLQEATIAPGSISRLGQLLMSDYVLAFELAGILLLIALIAAAYLARESAETGQSPKKEAS